ncbi:MAG: alpha/beta hydrolase [Cyanobacteria bacterium SZAS LIN-3]|nr:alpha/beta hydrolase [Cyanobacteria bacterium SZAS LIN-3]
MPELDFEQKTVTVYGITNRHLAADGQHFEDGELEARKDDVPHYYKEVVPVLGRGHDYRATGPGEIKVIDKTQFDRETGEAVKNSGGRLGIFIHGIRNAVGEPGQKAAELSVDSGETFIVEDWASTKEMPPQSRLKDLLNIAKQQSADYQSSAQSQEMINETAVDLIDRFGAKNIDLVAHSRGGINQARLLVHLQNKGQEPVHSATFAHSDVNAADFAHAMPHFYQATRHINLLYSGSDRALRVSAMQKYGLANLDDGCTISDNSCLGNVGGNHQMLQNEAHKLVGRGYFLSMPDVTDGQDANGHLMTSARVAELLTIPDIWDSSANEMKNGPVFKAIEPPAPTTKNPPPPLPQEQIKRDFVSASPEVKISFAPREPKS